MNDYSKTKETLIRELEELRQRVGFLESLLADKNKEYKSSIEHDTHKLSRKELWQLPGYWH